MEEGTEALDVFTEYGDILAKEADIREELRDAVKGVEVAARDIDQTLIHIHKYDRFKTLESIAEQAESKFVAVQEAYKVLDSKIPLDSYWKYSNIWSNTNSWISYLASLTLYIKTEKLADKDEVSKLLGMDEGMTRLHLDIEDYLLGLCHLCSELARLAVNSVTKQDYNRPVRIVEFLNTLSTGFRLLNLKNDNLRKKFDSIKWQLKKVEEVVYDLSIRGLVNQAGGETSEVAEGIETTEHVVDSIGSMNMCTDK